MVTFQIDSESDNWRGSKEEGNGGRKEGREREVEVKKESKVKKFPVIFKTGDDLRQDQVFYCLLFVVYYSCFCFFIFSQITHLTKIIRSLFTQIFLSLNN